VSDLVRVLVVEDHPLYRQAVSSLVDAMEGWQVIGAYGDAERALPRAQEAELVLLDLTLPGIDGIDAARLLKAANPGLAVVVLTMSQEPAVVSAAVRAGACGFLVKGAEPEDIERALRSVARGHVVFDAQVAPALLASAGARASSAAAVAFPALSARELEVLDLLAAGRSNAEIAGSLFVSDKTARNHVSNILVKLGVGRLEAAARGRAAGLGRG
jgi:DNA-binding NarL/FixJ family response regulator